jgi:hypothetical protein
VGTAGCRCARKWRLGRLCPPYGTAVWNKLNGIKL